MMRQYNTEVFTNEDNTSYYLLGLYITDGNVYVKKNQNAYSIELKSIDTDILEKIRNLVCLETPLTKSHNHCSRLRFFNKVIGNWLISKGCVPNKTKVVKFPIISEQFLPSFMRGLIDGDGSLGIYGEGHTRVMMRFDSASYDLILGFQQTLAKWNIITNISKTQWIESKIDGRKVKSKTQMYRISLTGLKAYKLLKIIYNDDGLVIDRKAKMAKEIFSCIEDNNPYSEEELLKLDRLPFSKIKWLADDLLVQKVLDHKGSLKKAAAELNMAAWTLSSRLRKIGKYDYIRSIYPFVNVNNLKAGSI